MSLQQVCAKLQQSSSQLKAGAAGASSSDNADAVNKSQLEENGEDIAARDVTVGSEMEKRVEEFILRRRS